MKVADRSSTNFCFTGANLRFYAFDLLYVDGEDLHYASFMDRKRRLRSVIPRVSDYLLYCDHIEEHGESLFRVACGRDLEGIVAKKKDDPYVEGTRWFKIRNPNYSQWIGRHELFEKERESDPDLLWDACTLACEGT